MALSARFEQFGVELLPQVSFSQLVKAEPFEVDAIVAGQLPNPYGWYLQTDVDLTFVTRAAKRPLVSLEYDGMSAGFSRDGRYVRTSTNDPHRATKLDSKIKMAEQVGYPLVVLGSNELDRLGANETLILAEGVAAELLASTLMPDLIQAKKAEVLAERPSAELVLSDYDELWLDVAAEERLHDEINPIRRAARTLLDLLGNPEPEVLFDHALPGSENMHWVYSTATARRHNATAQATVRMRNISLPVDKRELEKVPEFLRGHVGVCP